MSWRAASEPKAIARQTLRVGSVSFLNSKPLIYGLDRDPGVQLILDVPSRLLAGLQEHRFDVALLPVIDYQRLLGARIIPSGGIGCDGPTLTVRIFSRQRIDQTQVLACDPDSHTSVALARIILAETYGLRPRIVDLADEGNHPNAARLLIGDKVVTDEPRGMPHQLDLGAAWKQLTGKPFVFAVWTARGGVDLGSLPDRLSEARVQGMANVKQIVADHAAQLGWPQAMALQYLTRYLKFEIDSPQLDAIRHFHALARKHELIPQRLALRVYPD